MMTRLSILLSAAILASCTGPVPTERDLDNAYRQSMALAQQDIAALAQRRAKGEITAAQYAEQKQAIEDQVTARANDMVLTQHSLVESQRQAQGLPTPSNPQNITVPQAGSLSTGSTQRRFNDGDSGGFGAPPPGASPELSGGYTPGGGVRGANGRAF